MTIPTDSSTYIKLFVLKNHAMKMLYCWEKGMNGPWSRSGFSGEDKNPCCSME